MKKANPILRALVKITQVSPWFRRLIWHRWYQYLAGYQMENWRFMNYGYVPSDDDDWKLDLEPDDEPDRLTIQLYHFVVNGVDLSDCCVLEVGSGRGGGASFISRYHKPMSMTGLDYSQKIIRHCQKHLANDSLQYVHGKAESLPFPKESFDAVVNVESSHCYGSMPEFLAQVRRVLMPGGHLLFADFRHREALDVLDQQMEVSGMNMIKKTDITAGVLESMRQDNERKQVLIDRWAGRRLNGTIRQFAGVEGSEVHEGFRNRDIIYMHYLMVKPARAG